MALASMEVSAILRLSARTVVILLFGHFYILFGLSILCESRTHNPSLSAFYFGGHVDYLRRRKRREVALETMSRTVWFSRESPLHVVTLESNPDLRRTFSLFVQQE
jgi:hypothetical protein